MGACAAGTHHLTDDFEYANCVVPFMVEKTRKLLAMLLVMRPVPLIIALPESVLAHPEFDESLPTWLGDLDEEDYQVESMQGGGFLIQFFVLTGGRIEVALRVNTTQTFNPKSVHKISEDEISAVQGE